MSSVKKWRKMFFFVFLYLFTELKKKPSFSNSGFCFHAAVYRSMGKIFQPYILKMKVTKFVHNNVQTLGGNHPFLGQGVPYLSRVLQVTRHGVIMHIHIR